MIGRLWLYLASGLGIGNTRSFLVLESTILRGHHGLTVLRIIGTIWAFWRGFFAKVVENFAAFNNVVLFATNTNYSIG